MVGGMRGSGGGSATRWAELRGGSPTRGCGDLGHGGEGFGCGGTSTARRGSRQAVARRIRVQIWNSGAAAGREKVKRAGSPVRRWRKIAGLDVGWSLLAASGRPLAELGYTVGAGFGYDCRWQTRARHLSSHAEKRAGSTMSGLDTVVLRGRSGDSKYGCYAGGGGFRRG
ncbi:vegetative cell wall protein gp1-like [Iris pallida]|uniref:Vegetative cell wall protein gp1-like n=1 Tax=Iris pallida TaxID=29817 RepID=A0AAX6F5P4_IRIPA|nr:vegetative cell wall protein gp1-like [Iris pallida]